MKVKKLRAEYRSIPPLGGTYCQIWDGDKVVHVTMVCANRAAASLLAGLWVRENYNVVKAVSHAIKSY